MSDLFKNRFNYNSLLKLATEIKAEYNCFPIDEFLSSIMDKSWNALEFKQRVNRISKCLGKYLPSDYETAIAIIDKTILNYPICLDGFVIFFPAFVELFGQDDENWDISMAALARYTPYASAEFAVRSFILNNKDRMMKQISIWAKHDNEHVRRLASEGCRPALPWGQALPQFKKDPSPVIAILEQLKDDPSLYVRKSVANNLNDISKTHPDLVTDLAKDWYGKSVNTDWVVKHACRTLLKNGNKIALGIFGFADPNDIEVSNFALTNDSIAIGEKITFSFEITAKKSSKIRLEYSIDYVKANGKRNRKIFQISEFVFKDKNKFYNKTHSFKDTSTRKHYTGIHSITLIVNGAERGSLDFLLVPNNNCN